MNASVSAAPTSTTNITGLRHWMSGRSITTDCFNAAIARLAENRSRREAALRSRSRPSVVGSRRAAALRFRSSSSVISIAMLRTGWGSFRRSPTEGHRPQVLRQRAERRNRQKQQRTDDQNRAEQQEAEGHRVVANRPERDRRDLLAAQVEGHR